jgi:hypothetical protein
MSEAWVYKVIGGSAPKVMFTNRHVSSNIIYTLDELKRAVGDEKAVYRMVPVTAMEKALAEVKRRIPSLQQRFKVALLG